MKRAPPAEPFHVEQAHRVVDVNARGAGRRLDAYLAVRFSDWSRSAFARLIREGMVLSDRRGSLKPSTTLAEGEILRIYIPGLAPDAPPPPLPPIVYEDDALLVFDKPAGLLVHSVGQKWSYGLVGLARGARPNDDVDLSHRLDRETSGVVVLSKNPTVNRKMKELFQTRMVGKTYVALVYGTPPWDTAVCDAPLGPATGSDIELKRGPQADGDSARTSFTVLKRLPAWSLVACRPLTGRTHQIRAHLDILGHPILGDKIYGQPDSVFLEYIKQGPTDAVKAALRFPRHALHARAITFPHPVSGQALRVKAPLPADMRAIVDGAVPTWE